MKERVLNVFLFLLSLGFMVAGVLMIFFQKIGIVQLLAKYIGDKILYGPNTNVDFFVAFFGSFIFAWGIFFFLLTVFAVMELPSTKIYGFIFWGYTFWAIMSILSGVLYLGKARWSFVIIILVVYGVIFAPYLLTLPLKSSEGKDSGQSQQPQQ